MNTNYFDMLPEDIINKIEEIINKSYFTEHKSKMDTIFDMINKVGKIEDNINFEIDEEDAEEELDYENTFYWKFYGEERDMSDYFMWIREKFINLE